MRKHAMLVLAVMVCINLILLARLLSRTSAPERVESIEQPRPAGPLETTRSSARPQAQPASEEPPAGTPWSRLFSSNLRVFARNLRATRCPEETVKDIVMAEVNRRFAGREAAIKTDGSDHVPMGWSTGSNQKLHQRRREARALAREKSAMLRDALGYDVAVEIPEFATVSYDLRFESGIAGLSPEMRATMREINDAYRAQAEALEDRTRGFWEPADLDELERLKEDRRAKINALLSDDAWAEFALRTDRRVDQWRREFAAAKVTDDEFRALLKVVRRAPNEGTEFMTLLAQAVGDARAHEIMARAKPVRSQ